MSTIETADPASANTVPIREISRLTGVNTVTLRAWERRYGLLKPQRTGKGHRLYGHQDIEKVKEIQAWLKRGLAISKVNAILMNKDQVADADIINSVWTDTAQQVRQTLTNFQRRSLERLFDDLLATYPAEVIADLLILPVLNELQAQDYSTPSRLAFFNSVLLEQVYRVQYRQRQVLQQQVVLVLSCSASNSTLLPLLFNYSLLVHSFQAEFMGYLPIAEAIFCAQIMDAKAIVLTGYDVLDTNELQVHLKQWSERKSPPVILLGPVADLYRAVASAPETGIYACDNQQQALEQINLLLNPASGLSHA